MPEQYTTQFEKAAPAVKTKECPKCELQKPVIEFTKGQPNCKPCNANRYVTCHCGCKILRPEAEMGIYDVATNMYFLNQPHKDKWDGVKRDRQGFIREWL